MQRPILSVLTTCYNRERYIAAAIESVLASTFRDFEYLIVDDCSTDRTVPIARDFALQDPRIRVYINDRNLGDYPNRNKAVSHALGEYVKFVDSDDLLYPHGLQVMMESMRKFPDAGLGLSRPPDKERPFPVCLTPTESYRRHYFESGLFSNSPLSAVIKREAFHAVGGFSGKRFLGDTELWHRLARRFPTVLMPMGLTWWRDHGEQEAAEEKKTLQAVWARYAMEVEMLSVRECPLASHEAAKALASAREGHALEVMTIARRRSLVSALSISRASKLTPRDFFDAAIRRFLG